MAREITAGVLLKLKDKFSSPLQSAGISVQGFADKAVGMADKVNKAMSGVAGTFGSLGISIGALGTIKSTIDLDHRMARIGLAANASAAEVNKLKRQIFDTAMMPDIKLDADAIISGIEVVMDKTNDLQFAQNNMQNLGLAIQAAGASGEDIGLLFSEFYKFGYSAEEIELLMNDLSKQGEQGFGLDAFAKNIASVYTAYKAIGTSPEHIRKANAALQILKNETGSAEEAVSVLGRTMAALSDRDTQKKLKMLGINVRDSITKEFRDFNDIMFDIAAKIEKEGKADRFYDIFSRQTAMYITQAYRDYGIDNYKNKLINLGDTAGLLQEKSAAMADTLYSNLTNLKTAFMSFADNGLAEPLQTLTKILNKLAENPEAVTTAIYGIVTAIGTLGAIKIGAGIMSFISGINRMRKGGSFKMSPLGGLGGGAGIPVFVTNMGAGIGANSYGYSTQMSGNGGGTTMMPGTNNKGKTPGGKTTKPGKINPKQMVNGGAVKNMASKISKMKINPKNLIKGGGAFALLNLALAAPGLISDIKESNQDETLTNKGKGEATGGAIAETAGSLAGGVAGFAAGAALGSIIPGAGTIIGGLLGAGIGLLGSWLGGEGGRAVGEAIGGAVAGEDEQAWLKTQRAKVDKMIADYGVTREQAQAMHMQTIMPFLLSAKKSNRRYPGKISSAPSLPPEAQGSPGISPDAGRKHRPHAVNDLIITPRGEYSTHPADYLMAMKNPTALINTKMRDEVQSVQFMPQTTPVVVEGEIKLQSELVIDDKGYRLRQKISGNTTPYKFTVGSARNARMLQ
jgi:hypothetical protein